MTLNNFGMYLAGAFWPALFILIGFALATVMGFYKSQPKPSDETKNGSGNKK